jgi:hypothetical protein
LVVVGQRQIEKKTNTYLVEVSCETVTVVNSELAAIDADVESDAKVLGHKRSIRTILLEGHLSLKEGSLWGATVDLLWFSDHYGFVLEEVENRAESESKVFQTAFNDTFFKVSKKSKHLEEYNK